MGWLVWFGWLCDQELVITQSKDATGKRVPMTGSLAGHVARYGEPVNIADAYTDPRFDSSVDTATGFRTRNLVCFPIKTPNNGIIAVLQAVNKVAPSHGSSAFDEDDLQILEYMSGHAAQVLVKAQLLEKTVRSWAQCCVTTAKAVD